VLPDDQFGNKEAVMISKSVGKVVIGLVALLALALLVTQLANIPTEASSERGWQASAARWTALAATYTASDAQHRAVATYAARWTALANYYRGQASK
jgi:hypothetical protein